MLQRWTPTDVHDLFWLRNLIEVIREELRTENTKDDYEEQDREPPRPLAPSKETPSSLGPGALGHLSYQRRRSHAHSRTLGSSTAYIRSAIKLPITTVSAAISRIIIRTG